MGTLGGIAPNPTNLPKPGTLNLASGAKRKSPHAHLKSWLGELPRMETIPDLYCIFPKQLEILGIGQTLAVWVFI